MNRHLMHAFVSISFFLGLMPASSAEPWLTNRFAQNCAGCHAPGRLNRVPIDRRCTLSCQGCHTNPNGGGLRNAYGKWNSQRWLRSYRSEWLKHEETPAPFASQKYGKKIGTPAHSQDDRTPLITTDSMEPRTQDYNRKANPENIQAAELNEFLAHIPAGDPYWQKRAETLTFGFDLRLQSYATEDVQRIFLMASDFGFAFKPFPLPLQLVYESRFLGNPNNFSLDQMFDVAKTRSLYLLLDDLPWNSFTMTGYYVPLFGNDSPDHTKLSRKFFAASLTGNPAASHSLLFKSISVGLAPNVPYVNIHYIDKRIDEGDPGDQTKGYVLNTGLRFVSYGASVNYSLWSTRAYRPNTRDTKILMHNLSLASVFWEDRLYLGLETMISEVVRDQDFYRAAVQTFEGRYRLFREFYFTLELATSNAAIDLSPGQSMQQKYGVQHFLWSGMEWNGQLVIDDFQSNSRSSKTKPYFISQLHLYY